MRHFLLIGLLLNSVTLSWAAGEASQPDYWVKTMPAEFLEGNQYRDQFVTSEGTIPAGCFAQLIPEINGDDVVASVYLNRTTVRGCIDSQIPYSELEGMPTRYRIEEFLGFDLWKLKVCVPSESAKTQGEWVPLCTKIVVQFNQRMFHSSDLKFPVLVLDKVGEWE